MNTILWPILRRAMRHPKRIAVVDDRRRYRYLDLVGAAFHVAERIEQTTANPFVGLCLPTSGLFPIAAIASWMLGRTVVPINYLLAEHERQYIIDDSGIDTIVTADKFLEALGGWEPANVKRIAMDKMAFDGFPPLRLPRVSRADDIAVVLYTSGTSGRPKGVKLTHGNLRSNIEGTIEHTGFRDADCFLGVLPQFHSFGLTGLTILPLVAGAKVVYTARFVPKKLVTLIKKHKPEIFLAIPSMYNALLTVKSAEPGDFASLRYAVSGGEPLPRAVADNFAERFGVRIIEGYGLTETSPIAALSTPEQVRDGAVGRLLPDVESRIIDDEGHIQDDGGEGEIFLRGPNIMAGYHKMPEATAEVIDGEGFFRTGDWGKVDADGYLYITGRKKEMLIIGGENVFPREIEEVLDKHPAVKQSAVVGRTDPSRGEVPVAFVELNEDAGDSFDEKELRSYAREHLPNFKVPKEVRVLDALPRNPTGKVLRRDLVQIIKDEADAAE